MNDCVTKPARIRHGAIKNHNVDDYSKDFDYYSSYIVLRTSHIGPRSCIYIHNNNSLYCLQILIIVATLC